MVIHVALCNKLEMYGRRTSERRKQFSLFKKLLAAKICGFQTKDRSKSAEVTDSATLEQEKHGRAKVSACVIIIFI